MFCKYCGAQLPDDSRFCGVCGKSLSGEAEAPAKTEETQPVTPPVDETPQPINPPVQETPQPIVPPAATEIPVQQTPPQPITPPVQEVPRPIVPPVVPPMAPPVRPVNSPASRPQPKPKPPVKGRVMWWIFAGVAILLLLASFVTLGIKAAVSAVDSLNEDSVWIPEYTPPQVTDDWDTGNGDDWDSGSGDDWDSGNSDWNVDGWELGDNYLYGEWVSDMFDDGTVESLTFDYDGNLELWEATPENDSYLENWNDGSIDKTLVYSGTYWVDGDYLTMDFGDDGSNTYYVEMASLYDIYVNFDDGTYEHFEQVSW